MFSEFYNSGIRQPEKTILTPGLCRCSLAVDDPAGNAIDPLIDSYDIRQRGNDSTQLTPLDTYQAWLNDPAIMNAIGARGNYTECSTTNIPDQFDSTGDRSLL
jgi:hypothetical protein